MGERMNDIEKKNFFQERKEVAKQRLAICDTCDRYDPTTTQCKECGCFMILKSVFPASNCPLNKWSVDVDGATK
jgi:hypothetical protein